MAVNLNYNNDRSAALTSAPAHAQPEPYAGGQPVDGELGEPHHNVDPSSEDSTLDGNQADDPVAEDRRRSHDLTALARTMSRRSSVHPADGSNDPLNPAEGSTLDPFSDNFRPDDWAKAVFELQARSAGPDAPPPREAGVAFDNLNVYGYGSDFEYQTTVGNGPLKAWGALKGLIGSKGQHKVQILQGVDGVLHPGEMLVVLGPPGSGCSTFLKTLANETHGFFVSEDSNINYRGITREQMAKNFAGEAIYSAETEQHFPLLTVSQTLEFAAEARSPRNPPGGLSQHAWAKQIASVVMAVFGISGTRDVVVGNDYIRGVSGGQRKRVSIAEVALSNAPLALWDNSTRGLDSATSISFCKSIKKGLAMTNSVAAVAIYQAPQPAYDVFDKVIVLYEGRSIYFGRADAAREFFIQMGFFCADQETTPDFLTGLTSTLERRPRKGFENKVPRTPEEFEAAWKASAEYKALKQELAAYSSTYPVDGPLLENFKANRRAVQSKRTRPGSPYTLSYGGQIKLCLRRGFQRLRSSPSLTIFQLVGNSVMALIVSSVFYNLQPTTASFFSRGSLLFFAILLNAFGSALEILTLYAQRPIVDKQARYAFYRPSAEAFASMLTDMPYKICNAILFNLIIYFMTNLRREPGPFFFFFLFSFFVTLTMSMFFRSLASLSRSLSEALVPAALIILALVMYTGFAIPTRYMLGWISWIRYLNPVQYAFESLMINEFVGRRFDCAQTVPTGPTYPGAGTLNTVCSVTGAVPGQNFVDGEAFINENYSYYAEHKWRNFGILIAFMIGLMCLYLGASEVISGSKSKGELKLYPRTRIPKNKKKQQHGNDVEGGASARPAKEYEQQEKDVNIKAQTAIFHFEDLCYDIPVKGGTRRLLDHVDGWVKPGTLTALMGVSGAGKTTLLDVLASRVTMGVISGDILVDGNPRDSAFQRKTGYVQQQDLHLETATVREALQFSALLRQPAHVPRAEKLAYAEEILVLLEMDKYADAVVGVAGEGLNVEERKRLSIGVEMVAKPELLLFLDEPSSGLDAQTSMSVLSLLETLKNHGQAILCTIHQPSAMLFSRFDRLLFLAAGGKTIYFGEVGEESKILRAYFEKNGSPTFPHGVNPAEYMLEVIGAAPGSHTEIDWHEAWKASPERAAVKQELAHLKGNPKQLDAPSKADKWAYREFAAPMSVQYFEVTKRVFQQLWRSPTYIYSKTILCVLVPLFIGFSFFDAGTSQQGLQNQLFAIFLLFTVFGQLVQQILPQFVKQREAYEVRERPSRTYSWLAFMVSNILAEIFWNSLMAIAMHCCLYYPVGLQRNAAETGTTIERGGLFFLLVWAFMMFTSTFSHMIISFAPDAENGGNIANLIFSLCLIFCGVLATPSAAPRFWIWLFRLSPFTYLAEGLLGTAVGDATVVCAAEEYLTFQPTDGQSCESYMAAYIAAAGGYLKDPAATATCEFCQIKSTNVFLQSFEYNFDNRWRDWGIVVCYCVFNAFAACGLYWLARVPKKSRKDRKAEKAAAAKLEAQTGQPATEKQV